MALNLLNVVLFQALAKAQNKEATPTLSIAAAILPGGLVGVAIPLIAAPDASAPGGGGDIADYTEVPLLLGKDVDTAKSTLGRVSLVPKVIIAYHETKEVGKVFEQKPDGGDEVGSGTDVSIWVSKGPRPSTQSVASETKAVVQNKK